MQFVIRQTKTPIRQLKTGIRLILFGISDGWQQLCFSEAQHKIMYARSLAPLALLLPSVAMPAHANSPGLFIAQFDHLLGTSLTVKLMATSLTVARQAEQSVLAEIARLETVLSSYQPDSEFSRWMAAPIQKAVAVSDDLFAVLSGFDHWRAQTNGAINAAAEHLSQRWQQANQNQLAETDLQEALAVVNQTHWSLDSENQMVTRLTNAPLKLHTFAKSYVLEQAAAIAFATPGVDGLVLNSGGDLVVRGHWHEPVAVANPRADAENSAPIARLSVQNHAVATSGDYRRSLKTGGEWVSHIMDTRTGQPAREIISATVVHPDAVTAGALATAFSVLTPSESAVLAAKLPGTEYLLITQEGKSITSSNWPGSTVPNAEITRNGPSTTAHLLSISAKDKPWNPNQELLISLEVARIEAGMFERGPHRPFVAVWIEDEAGKPIRQLALWYNKPRWLHDLREWYNLHTGNAASVTSATRSPGQYTLAWDGKDDKGQLVKQGKYTVLIEAAREHGSYQLIRQVMDFNGKTKQQTLNGNVEIATAALDYREKAPTR